MRDMRLLPLDRAGLGRPCTWELHPDASDHRDFPTPTPVIFPLSSSDFTDLARIPKTSIVLVWHSRFFHFQPIGGDKK